MIVSRNPSFWSDKFTLPMLQRVGHAPDDLVSHIARVNAATGRREIPVAAIAPDDLLTDLGLALRGLPEVVVRMLDSVLLGVYFLRGVGSSAVTDVVVDEDGHIIGSVVAIDMDAFLGRRANEWVTWKENTPFGLARRTVLEVVIAESRDDTRANAMQFLLLHEFGHVLSAGRQFLPVWWLPPEFMQATDDYAFLRLAWQIDADNQIIPKPEEAFAGQDGVAYYEDGALGDESMIALYRGWLTTSFATLYATTSVYEDFAETFATYVHSVLLRKPSRLRIYCDGILVFAPAEFWSDARSAPKRAFMAQLMAER